MGVAIERRGKCLPADLQMLLAQDEQEEDEETEEEQAEDGQC